MHTQLSFRTEEGRLALVAFGANLTLGRRLPADTVNAAIDRLNGEKLWLCKRSPLYATPCFPAGEGPDFVNACATYWTNLAPDEVLSELMRVEAQFGRTRLRRWGGRTLDLDLLAVDDLVRPDVAGFRAWADLPVERQMAEAPDDLILPHPRLQDRAFVLVPLADVAPGWRHPVLGRSVIEMRDALPAAARAEIARV